MQQFRRKEPERLTHGNEGETRLAPADPGNEKRKVPVPLNLSQHTVRPITPAGTFTSDNCWQMGAASACTLEDNGFFFCLICQKDLSNMNSVRRTQHVNRCLDEGEQKAATATSSIVPLVPECPICGKQFKTFKGRISHLKRCASDLEVPPQLLLQAVQRQNSQAPERPVPSASAQSGRLKRKGSTREQPVTKKGRQEMDENTMVAMALSASLLEQERQEETELTLSLQADHFILDRAMHATNRKGQKKRKDVPSMLLGQDPELACRRVQDRLSLLLSEEREECRTPLLPVSTLAAGGVLKRVCYVWPGAAGHSSLWCRSALSRAEDGHSALFYSSDLVPPITPWKSLQERVPELAAGNISTAALAGTAPELAHQRSTPESKTKGEAVIGSQQERTFFDLMDLAGEGMTLTQWDSDLKNEESSKATGSEGSDSPADTIVPSGFVPTQSEENQTSNLQDALRKLTTDLGVMVNNPHLSDVQFQVDTGEIVYAHQFILYARSPQLVQTVHTEGLLVEEDGATETRRLLLPEVSVQAVLALLHYLYTSRVLLSPLVSSELHTLANRFVMSELEEICRAYSVEAGPDGADSESGPTPAMQGEEYGNLQDLLRSMWMDEVEELALESPPPEGDEADEGVGDEELDEIYQFAATQRPMKRSSLMNIQKRESGCGETEGEMDVSGGNKQSVEGSRIGSKAVKHSDSLLTKNKAVSELQHSLKPLEMSNKIQVFQLKESLDCSLETDMSPNTSDCLFSGTDVSVELQCGVNHGEMSTSNVSITNQSFMGCISPAHSSMDRNSPLCKAASPSACLVWSDLPVVGVSPLDTEEKSTLHPQSSDPATPPRPMHPDTSSTFMPIFNGQPHKTEEQCDMPGTPCDLAGPTSLGNTHKVQQCALVSPISINSSPLENKSNDILVVTDSEEETGKIEKEVTRPCPRSEPLCSGPEAAISAAGKLDVHSVSTIPQGRSRVSGIQPKGLTLDPKLLSIAKECDHGSQHVNNESELTLRLSSDSEPNYQDLNVENPLAVPATPSSPETSCCPSLTHNQTAKMGRLFEEAVKQEVGTLRAGGMGQEAGAHHTQEKQTQHINLDSDLDCSAEGNSVIRLLSDSSPLTPFPLTRNSDCVELESEDTSAPLENSMSDRKETTDTSMVEILDTEEEMPSSRAEQFEDEPPLPFDHELWSAEESPCLQDDVPGTADAFPCRATTRVEPITRGESKNSTPLPGRAEPRVSFPGTGDGSGGEGDITLPSRLDSILWEEEDDLPQVLGGPSQKLPDSGHHVTRHNSPVPVSGRSGQLPSAPLTPEPPYSTMATPCLKRELGKFGVRPLPKRKMILKLKEIYNYTHRAVQPNPGPTEQQRLSSQPCGQKPKSTVNLSKAHLSGTNGLKQRSSSAAMRRNKPALKGQLKVTTNKAGSTLRPGTESAIASEVENQLSSSQSSSSSALSGDSFHSDRLSASEFGDDFSTDSDKEDDVITPSQAVVWDADTTKAIRQFIQSNPSLYSEILQYKPFELTDLHQQLKENGIKVSKSKLVDFLDAQSITFTTARARKEVMQRRKQGAGRCRGKPGCRKK
ncbi:structure-specific endonuclease subunit SLX4 isoform X2 [Narcine bancroftii]